MRSVQLARMPNTMIRLLSTLFSVKLSIHEKLRIVKTEYNIPIDDKLRRDVSAMCNLSQGIRENAIDQAIAGVIMNMHREGYTSEQIAKIVEKTAGEIETVIKNRETVSV